MQQMHHDIIARYEGLPAPSTYTKEVQRLLEQNGNPFSRMYAIECEDGHVKCMVDVPRQELSDVGVVDGGGKVFVNDRTDLVLRVWAEAYRNRTMAGEWADGW